MESTLEDFENLSATLAQTVTACIFRRVTAS